MGVLFIIGIEILGNAIRNSDVIKGKDIEPGKTVKLAQYTDITTVVLEDSESILHLFELLLQFEKWSGLQSKSELPWLGSDHFRKDKIRNLKLNEEPILALGIYFSYDDKLVAQKNFFDKVGRIVPNIKVFSLLITSFILMTCMFDQTWVM